MPVLINFHSPCFQYICYTLFTFIFGKQDLTVRLPWQNNALSCLAGDTLGSPGGGATTAGFEAGYYDGPWTNPEDASHFSGYLRRTGGTGDDKWALTLLGYHASWNSTDQVPLRAIDGGLISRFGAIDPSDGGATTGRAFRSTGAGPRRTGTCG